MCDMVVLSVGDIVQIVNAQHAWYPCVLIVDEVKIWGVQAYVIHPLSNQGSGNIAIAPIRLKMEDVQKVGESLIKVE